MTKKELNNRIQSFSKLGELMKSFGQKEKWPGFEIGCTQEEYIDFEDTIVVSKHHNGWFTEDNVRMALAALGNELTEENISLWLNNYSLIGQDAKTIGIIMAGNIPLVGFHDFLCVLLAGHRVKIKLSSDDKLLLPGLVKFLINFKPEFKEEIEFVDGKLEKFDAVIATGSNNTARYFNYYFGKYPNIIRKNRNSVAVLDGTETPEELNQLGHDIFDYFGLGCRNVTKLYLPEGYEIDKFFKGIFNFSQVVHANKYANNYDYNKAVWLLNLEKLLDNGFIILREDETIASATGSLNYEYYSDRKELNAKLSGLEENIQCVISRDSIPFGDSQKPKLYDYADGVDTIAFLVSL